uniref:Uncharacterized protein n=1 Tax=Arundo donax TaxID=35708 RepID=A0A0A9BBJ3_ARUDO
MRYTGRLIESVIPVVLYPFHFSIMWKLNCFL